MAPSLICSAAIADLELEAVSEAFSTMQGQQSAVIPFESECNHWENVTEDLLSVPEPSHVTRPSRHAVLPGLRDVRRWTRQGTAEDFVPVRPKAQVNPTSSRWPAELQESHSCSFSDAKKVFMNTSSTPRTACLNAAASARRPQRIAATGTRVSAGMAKRISLFNGNQQSGSCATPNVPSVQQSGPSSMDVYPAGHSLSTHSQETTSPLVEASSSSVELSQEAGLSTGNTPLVQEPINCKSQNKEKNEPRKFVQLSLDEAVKLRLDALESGHSFSQAMQEKDAEVVNALFNCVLQAKANAMKERMHNILAVHYA